MFHADASAIAGGVAAGHEYHIGGKYIRMRHHGALNLCLASMCGPSAASPGVADEAAAAVAAGVGRVWPFEVAAGGGLVREYLGYIYAVVGDEYLVHWLCAREDHGQRTPRALPAGVIHAGWAGDDYPEDLVPRASRVPGAPAVPVKFYGPADDLSLVPLGSVAIIFLTTAAASAPRSITQEEAAWGNVAFHTVAGAAPEAVMAMALETGRL